jgi:hypothetical protein
MAAPSKIGPVALYDSDQLFGIVVEVPTGVVFTNQIGGTACSHPEVEGVFLPFPFIFDSVFDGSQDSIDPCFDILGLSKEQVTRFLRAAPDTFETYFDPEGDPTRLHVGGEAWVPVRIKNEIPEYGPLSLLLKSFVGMKGWITYSNSD